MRILQLAPVPKKVGGKMNGGVATHSWDLARHLTNDGHEVAILADNVINPDESPYYVDGVEIWGVRWDDIIKSAPEGLFNYQSLSNIFNFFSGFKLSEIAKYAIYGIHCHNVMKRTDPDIIHAHHLGFRVPFAQYENQRTNSRNKPLLVSVHGFHGAMFGSSSSKRNRRKLLERNMEEIEYLILNSDQVEQEFFEFLGEKAQDSTYWVGMNGIDTNKYYPIDRSTARNKVGLNPDKPHILFVSRFEERKGVYQFIHAIKECYESGLEFDTVMIGTGEEEEGVSKFLSENGIRDRVQLIERVPSLLNYYNSASLLVVPSYHEDFGLVYAEALACGTPVVGTENIPTGVIPKSGQYGFRTPIQKSDPVAEAIKDGLEREWDREDIAEYATKFDWDTKMEKYNKIYNFIIEQKNI